MGTQDTSGQITFDINRECRLWLEADLRGRSAADHIAGLVRRYETGADNTDVVTLIYAIAGIVNRRAGRSVP